MKKALFRGAFLFLGLIFSVACADTTQVRYVIDGDTLVLNDGRHVRLLGINAPELGKDGNPDQPLAQAAKSRLKDLIAGGPVTLTPGKGQHDRHRRLLAYCQLADGRSVEEILVREGLAWMVAVPPDVAHVESLKSAEDEARAARRGVWNESAFQPVAAARLTARDGGFRFIEGTILRTVRGKNVWYFDLAPRVALLVSHQDWKKYYGGQPSALVGRRVIARGWLTESKGRLRMRVPHPAMLTWGD